MWVLCEWHKIWAKLYNKVPVAPYLGTNVVNRMDELVDWKKEGCKDTYSKETANNQNKAKMVWLLKINFMIALK